MKYAIIVAGVALGAASILLGTRALRADTVP